MENTNDKTYERFVEQIKHELYWANEEWQKEESAAARLRDKKKLTDEESAELMECEKKQEYTLGWVKCYESVLRTAENIENGEDEEVEED